MVYLIGRLLLNLTKKMRQKMMSIIGNTKVINMMKISQCVMPILSHRLKKCQRNQEHKHLKDSDMIRKTVMMIFTTVTKRKKERKTFKTYWKQDE